MATLHVRGFPEELYERLREEAKASRRSISAKAIELLRRAMETETEGPKLSLAESLKRADHIRAKTRWEPGMQTVVESIREDRER